MFGDLSTGIVQASEAGGLTLGTAFYSDTDGYVTRFRWRFPDPVPSGPVTALLYRVTSNTTAVERANAVFASPTAGAWNTVALDTPAAVAANVLHVVAVQTPDRYVAVAGQFSAAPVASGHLTAIRDATDPTGQFGELIRNGRFKAGGPTFPDQTFGANGYLPDVEFETSIGGDEVANPVYATLLANTDTEVTLDANYGLVEVTLVSGAATTYFNAADEAIGSIASPPDGNHVLNSTLLAKVVEDKTGGAPSVVHLRSSGTPTVCVWGM